MAVGDSSEHNVRLDNRKKAAVTGVTEVVSFDDKEIILKTKQGGMNVKGADLTLTRLDLEKGEIDLSGKVDAVIYSKNKQKHSRFLSVFF